MQPPTASDVSLDSPPEPQPLIPVFGAAVLGATVDRLLGPLGVWTWLAVIAAGVGWFRFRRVGRPICGWLCIYFLVAAAAVQWHHARWRLFDADEIGLYAGGVAEPIALEAVVTGALEWVPEPKFSPFRIIPGQESTRLPLRITTVRDGLVWRPASGKTFAAVSGRLTGFGAGDRVRIVGRIVRPSPALNLGEFDAALHSRGERVLCYIRCNHVENVELVRRSWRPQRLLDAAASTGRQRLLSRISPENRGLAAALLLGDRHELELENRDALLESGVVHLVAISGLHVGIVAALLLVVLRPAPLSFGSRTAFVVLGVFGYAALTGWQPPVVRAVILVLVAGWSLWIGRRPSGFNSLAAAGLVVFSLRPAAVFEVGPQLSFLAVATLMATSRLWLSNRAEADPLQRLIAETRSWWVKTLRSCWAFLARLFLSGLAVWVAAGPLVAARFHLIAPAAVVLGPVVWLPAVGALTCGAVAMLCPAACEPLPSLAAAGCDGCLTFLMTVVEAARDTPLGPIWTPGPPAWALAVIYGGFGAWVLVPQLRRYSKSLVGACAVLLLLGALIAPAAKKGEFRCTFIAVGHGLCVLIETPDGESLLYDAGSLVDPAYSARSIASVLWSRGIGRLDGLILSHADADHYNAAPELLRKFGCDRAFIGPLFAERQATSVQALLGELEKHSVPVRTLQSGDVLVERYDLLIRVLHPPAEGVSGGEDNAQSLVLAVEYAGRRILLTGDLEPPGLGRLLTEVSLDCDVVQAPHHGSPAASPPEFLDWCRPETLVVSCGAPAIERAAAVLDSDDRELLLTARDGAITATIDQQGQLAVESFLPSDQRIVQTRP